MLLARNGYRVLLVDRATFPSDTLSTHFICLPGVIQLQRWGLLEQVIASNCPPITAMTSDTGDTRLTGYPPALGGMAALYAPWRFVLDMILLRAAGEAGVEIGEGVVVQDFLWDGPRVVGVRGRTGTGAPVEETARVVIGADGRHSRVARRVDAPSQR